MEIFKILFVCFIAAALAVLLKQYKGEYALAVSVGAGVTVLITVINSLVTAFTETYSAFAAAGIDTYYFTVVLKAVGIGWLTRFIADTCRDSGHAAIASGAELAGRCAIFLLSLPLLLKLLEIAKQILV